jgi:hypothetical protein
MGEKYWLETKRIIGSDGKSTFDHTYGGSYIRGQHPLTPGSLVMSIQGSHVNEMTLDPLLEFIKTVGRIDAKRQAETLTTTKTRPLTIFP